MYGFIGEWGAEGAVSPAADASVAVTPLFTQPTPFTPIPTPVPTIFPAAPVDPTPLGPAPISAAMARSLAQRFRRGGVLPIPTRPSLRFVIRPRHPPTLYRPQVPVRFAYPKRRGWWGRRKGWWGRKARYQTDAFLQAVMRQVGQLRNPLASVQAIRFPQPPEFGLAPGTPIMAELQGAYWLAVGSRIALGQGNYSAARRLAEGAHLFINRVKSGRHNDIATTVNEVREYISTTGSQQLPQAVLNLYSEPEGEVLAGYGADRYGAVNLVYGQPEITLQGHRQIAVEEVEMSQASLLPPTPGPLPRWLVAAAVLIPLLAVMGGAKKGR